MIEPEQSKAATKRRKSKLARERLRKHAKAYGLDQEWDYEAQMSRLLRQVGNWIARRGWCPTVKSLAESKKYDMKAVEKYLDDAIEAGLVEILAFHGIMLTELGWEMIRAQPVEPVLSTAANVRGREIAAAKTLRRLEQEPRLRAILDAKKTRGS